MQTSPATAHQTRAGLPPKDGRSWRLPAGDHPADAGLATAWMHRPGLMVWLRHMLRTPSRQVPDAEGSVLACRRHCCRHQRWRGRTACRNRQGGRRVTIRTGLADAQLQRSPVAGRIYNFRSPACSAAPAMSILSGATMSAAKSLRSAWTPPGRVSAFFWCRSAPPPRASLSPPCREIP